MHLIPPAVVFGIVMGSLYFGIATAAESAALGVIAALGFVWQSGKLNRELLRNCFVSTARVSGMILLIVAAAFILNLTVSLTGVAEAMTKWVAGLGLSATGLDTGADRVLPDPGMFMDVLSMQVATIPITYPIATRDRGRSDLVRHLHRADVRTGPDHAARGMNLFVVHGIRPDKGGIEDAIYGACAVCGDHDPVHAVADGRPAAGDLGCRRTCEPPMNKPLWQLTAMQLAAGFRDASFTPIEALQACMARSEEVNPRLNAIVALDFEGRDARGRAKHRALARRAARSARWTGCP